MDEEKIAQGTYDFRVMREDGYRYVDKTALLYPLVTRGRDSFFFISRPRRFGKSLMLSTLACLFRGQRELFKGLAIDQMDYDWESYPILQFSFAGIKSKTIEAFEEDFKTCLEDAFTAAKAPWNPDISPGANFRRAIRALVKDTGKPVVILIDEYDAPVGHALADIKLASAIRQELSDFYIQIKNNVGAIRFMMMTGVTRFTQLSVFSALNNLTDLTMDSRYATLLGYTDEELEANFSKTLHRHAEVMGLSYEDYREQLRWWYNGYRFARWNTTKVYNPYAIGQTLGACEPEFIGTWIATGQTSAVINYFTNNQLVELDYEHIEGVSEEDLNVCGLENIQPISMLYQGGYLTIKEYRRSRFTLGIPDEEVRRALNSLLVQKFAETPSDRYRNLTCQALEEADFDTFFGNLSDLYAHLTYGPKENRVHEFSFQRILYVLLTSDGSFRVTAEDRQSHGRADLVAETPERVFVFELKVDGTPQEALDQIKEKGYAEPYRHSGKEVHLIGLSFDGETRRLTGTASEPLA